MYATIRDTPHCTACSSAAQVLHQARNSLILIRVPSPRPQRFELPAVDEPWECSKVSMHHNDTQTRCQADLPKAAFAHRIWCPYPSYLSCMLKDTGKLCGR